MLTAISFMVELLPNPCGVAVGVADERGVLVSVAIDSLDGSTV